VGGPSGDEIVTVETRQPGRKRSPGSLKPLGPAETQRLLGIYGRNQAYEAVGADQTLAVLDTAPSPTTVSGAGGKPIARTTSHLASQLGVPDRALDEDFEDFEARLQLAYFERTGRRLPPLTAPVSRNPGEFKVY
jgi:hypothetical protein